MPFPPTPSITPSNTPTPSITATNTPTNSPSATSCPGSSPTITPSVSLTPTNTQTSTPTGTIVLTPTNTSTNTSTPTNTPTQTPSQTVEGNCLCYCMTYSDPELPNDLYVRYAVCGTASVETELIQSLPFMDNGDGTLTTCICVRQGGAYAIPVCVQGGIEVTCDPYIWISGSACSSYETCFL
jgi:hypothetical protein